MKGKLIDFDDFGREIFVYLPNSYNKFEDKRYPVVYLHDGDTVKKLLNEIMTDIEEYKKHDFFKDHIIVGISPKDRLSEYTPWKAPSLVEKFKPFEGRGEEYLLFR